MTPHPEGIPKAQMKLIYLVLINYRYIIPRICLSKHETQTLVYLNSLF